MSVKTVSTYLAEAEKFVNEVTEPSAREVRAYSSLINALQIAEQDSDQDPVVNGNRVNTQEFARILAFKKKFLPQDQSLTGSRLTISVDEKIRQLQSLQSQKIGEKTDFATLLSTEPLPAMQLPENLGGSLDLKHTKVRDPYSYINNSGDPNTQAFLNAQSAYSQVLLKHPDFRAAFQKYEGAIKAAIRFDSRTDQAKVTPSGIFYIKVPEDKGVGSLCWRKDEKSPEKILIDPNRFSGPEKSAILAYSVSPGGKYIAYVFQTPAGKKIKFYDVDHAKILSEEIRGIGRSQFAWLDDQKLIYNKAQKPTETVFLNTAPAVHKIGSSSPDISLLAENSSGIDSLTSTSFVGVMTYPKLNLALAYIREGVSQDRRIYLKKLDQVENPQIPWTQISSLTDRVEYFGVHGNSLYFVTARDPRPGTAEAERKRSQKILVRVDIPQTLPSPPLSLQSLNPTLLFPDPSHQGKYALQEVVVQEDAVYITGLNEKMNHEVIRIPHDNPGKPQLLPIPEGSVHARADFYQTNMDPSLKGAAFRFARPIGPEVLYRYNPVSPTPLQAMELNPRERFDPAIYETRMVYVYDPTSNDQVPLKLTYKKGTLEWEGNDLKLKNPNAQFMMDLYGAYEAILSPYNRSLDFAALAAWADQGNVYVEAHLLGGGRVSGMDGHLAGQFENKKNTISGTIAGGQWIYDKFSKHPVLITFSAGGIAALNAAMERPELFAGVVAVDPSADLIGILSQTKGAGPANRVELGDPFQPKDFQFLSQSAPYSRMISTAQFRNKKLPPLYLASSPGDNTVPPPFATKIVPPWQAGPSTALIVTGAGDHVGIGSPVDAQTEGGARILAFSELVSRRKN